MVDTSYPLHKPSRPSDLKRFFDQRLMPTAIDGAARLDIGIVKTVEHIRRNPAMALGLAIGMGALLAAWVRQGEIRRR